MNREKLQQAQNEIVSKLAQIGEVFSQFRPQFTTMASLAQDAETLIKQYLGVMTDLKKLEQEPPPE